MTRFDNNFANAVHDFVKPGMRVLDMGAGAGDQAKRFMSQGAVVTAVEPRGKPEQLAGVEWIELSVEEFLKTCPDNRQFDFVFIQNLIHFLPKPFVLETLLPWVCAYTAPGGGVAIRTFTASPVPPYSQDLSYYTPEDLKSAFPGWEKIVAETMESLTKTHKFFLVDRMVKKPGINSSNKIHRD